MMAKSYIAVRKNFDALPEDTRSFLAKMTPLLDDSSNLDVALAYTFMKLEEGNHRALKCGLVRLHKCDSAKADDALSRQHFTRKYFRTIFKNVLGEEVPKTALDALAKAEKVRDKQIHGKTVTAAEQRNALIHAFFYIAAVGSLVEAKARKNPFGDLRGLKGKTTLLDGPTSYWLLKGIGFYTNATS